jgi:UDPglucose 6-dehydrogenase
VGKPAVGVIGAGYVGLVTAACFAELGHRVVCTDIDAGKVEALQAGRVPIHEPGVEELLRAHAGRLTFSTDNADAITASDVVFVCVDTPPLASGDADLRRVDAVLSDWPRVERPVVLVMKSTVPAGTGARIIRSLAARGLGHVAYVSSPEFLREGSAVHDFLHPDRVVVGAERPEAAQTVASLYEPLHAPIVRTDVASAEMIKLAANAFLATKISFINEIANVCEEVGADVEVVATGMGLDARIGQSFLRAGIGYGGSCFPKDVTALKRLAGNSGYHFQLLASVIEVNELQKRRLLGKLRHHLGPLTGATVALLGLAFKPNTDDVRESPAFVLASRLVAEGACVVAHDPVAAERAAALLPPEVVLAGTVADAVAGADAAVIVTDWPSFATALLAPGVAATMRRPLLLDGRNLLEPAAARAAGFEWIGTGRPQSP